MNSDANITYGMVQIAGKSPSPCSFSPRVLPGLAL